MNETFYSFIFERVLAMDKKLALKSAAHDVFSNKGYKATNISEISKQAGMAVGSFYNYYDSKEAIFLDVYINENNRVRQTIIDKIDWNSEIDLLIEQLFDLSRKLISSNKIMLEWNNPAISNVLRNFYDSEEGKDSNLFHQFLVEKFTLRLLEEGYCQDKIQEILQVYQLFYYLDMNLTEDDFPKIDQTVEILAKYFVKGLFK